MLTVRVRTGNATAAATGTNVEVTFASETLSATLSLEQISVGVITQALENIAYLRAQNGGVASRLAFNSESFSSTKDEYACRIGSNGRCGYC